MNAVTEIKTQDVYESVKRQGNCVIMFHRLDCAPCKATMPRFKNVAQKYGRSSAPNRPPVLRFYTVESEFASKVDPAVRFFPTLVLRNGEDKELRQVGEMTEQAIYAWLGLAPN